MARYDTDSQILENPREIYAAQHPLFSSRIVFGEHKALAAETAEPTLGEAKSLQAATSHENTTCSTIEQISAHEKDEEQELPIRPWKRAWMRWGPLTGLLCMVVAACSIAASFVILVTSHNSPTNQWRFEPSAYLAVFTAVANQSLRMAVVHGVAIAWWTRALKGTSLKELHYEYEWLNGLPSWKALSSGYGVTMIGLACIASALVAVDGPLLQRASSVISAPISNHVVSVNVSISPEVPRATYGSFQLAPANIHYVVNTMMDYYIPTSNNGTTINNVMLGTTNTINPVRPELFTDQPISGFASGCPGTCRVQVRAPAIVQVSEVSHMVPVDFHQRWEEQWNATSDAMFVPSRLAFLVYMGLMVDGPYEQIIFISGSSRTEDCIGTFNYTIRTLEAAVGEYDITITNGTVSPSELGAPSIVALANNTYIHSHQGQQFSTLAGIVSLFSDEYDAAILMETLNYEPAELADQPSAGLQFLEGNEPWCPSYRDPGEWMIQRMNQMMFRVGVFAAQSLSSSLLEQRLDPGLEVNTTVIGQVSGEHNVFQTDLWWFMAAALVEIVCVSLILPTYFGWWRIGRKVSFSPLEIAKAFEAPLLSQCNSNSTAKDIAKSVGDVKIRYGAIVTDAANDGSDGPGAKKLAFANPQEVYHPVDKWRFEV